MFPDTPFNLGYLFDLTARFPWTPFKRRFTVTEMGNMNEEVYPRGKCVCVCVCVCGGGGGGGGGRGGTLNGKLTCCNKQIAASNIGTKPSSSSDG